VNLIIKNLFVRIKKNNKILLNGINLTIPNGEIHAIMGPNGSGKSTLAMVIAGHPNYFIEKGDILSQKESIVKLLPDTRARHGIFLAFQHPLEIPGVNTGYFLRTIIKVHNKYKKNNFSSISALIESYLTKLGMNSDFLKRDVNDCFSGGEKKRNEIIQMMILRPKICILDEIDSGLDIDALKFVSACIDNFIIENPKSIIVMVTHYSRLFQYVKPQKIHILIGGKIIKSGSLKLVKDLENTGYQNLY